MEAASENTRGTNQNRKQRSGTPPPDQMPGSYCTDGTQTQKTHVPLAVSPVGADAGDEFLLRMRRERKKKEEGGGRRTRSTKINKTLDEPKRRRAIDRKMVRMRE